MDKLVKKLELSLFSLTVFLIPTNLSLKFSENTAYVHGILVDYLIPKLYLSDLTIILLLAIWLIGSRPRLNRVRHTLLRHQPILILLTVLYLSTFTSANPIASAWFVAKLIQMTLFALWMFHKLELPKHLTKPLTFTLVFQALIGLFQWAQRRSILGYLFLGETTLKTAGNIAKTTLSGELRPLPYGTTPHPNVLAGFLAIGLLILVTRPKPVKKGWLKLTHLLARSLTYLLCLIAMLLTQSASALLVLIAGSLLAKGQKFLGSFTGALAVITALVLISLAGLTFIDPESLNRRSQLALISLEMVTSRPLLGTGPNNFTALLPSYGEITSTTTRFIQPSHNIYLLWLVETGLLGTLALAYLLWHYRRLFKTLTNRQAIPLLMLLAIGLFDHYPLTLQTGQLLFALTAALATIKTKPT